MNSKITGNLGERIALKKYLSMGYKKEATNFKVRVGEIDLIVRKANLLVFVEVKTRKDASFDVAARAVTPSKQKRIKAAAGLYLQKRKYDDPFVRFDVAEVYDPYGKAVVNIIENAFE